MSIISKVLNIMKSGKHSVHDGTPYSLEELCSMDNEELGRLYKNHGNPPYVPHKASNRINIVSIFILLSMWVSLTAIGFIMNGGVAVSAISFGSLLLFSLTGVIIGLLAAVFYMTVSTARAGGDVFDEVTNWNVKLWNLRNKLVIGNKNSSKFKTFINDIDKVIWPKHLYDKARIAKIGRCWKECPINDYSDENLGRLLKILLPIMKFNYDGGTLDDESFKALDDKLKLSERLEDYKNQVISMMIDDKKRKTEEEEELNAKKQSDKSMGLVKDVLNQVPDDYDDSKRNEILEKSSSMHRLEDLIDDVDLQREKFEGTILNDAKVE